MMTEEQLKQMENLTDDQLLAIADKLEAEANMHADHADEVRDYLTQKTNREAGR